MQANGNAFPFDANRRQIKPIPTRYRGREYRSRLEARWAVAFDWCWLDAEYEKEGFVVKNKPYLPDFWLPELEMYVEVKPTYPTEEEINLIRGLRDLTNKWCAIFYGQPGENNPLIYYWDESGAGTLDGSVGCGEFEMQICSSNGTKKSILWLCHPEAKSRNFFYSQWEIADILSPEDAHRGEWLGIAIDAGLNARFEHGADPRPPWLK